MHDRLDLRRSPFGCLLLALLALVLSHVLPLEAIADVIYMPDVTAAMSQPDYWSSKVGNPDTVLASQEQIAAINSTILADSESNMNDLAAWEEGTFDGQAYADVLKRAAEQDATDAYNSMGGWYYWDEAQGTGVYMSTWEEAKGKLYGPMIENACDGDATTEMPIRFGICTTRTNLLTFPSTARILDDVNDPDFDLQYQTMVRLGEPLVIKGESNDGAFYHAYSSCSSGWIPAQDVAVCADRQEWLSAWQFAPEQTLVVFDDKVFTEESAYAPAASQKQLSMGTCLKLATADEYGNGALLGDIDRSGYNCHVVWLPIRTDGGGYDRMLALISEHCKVSEGYLPLTYANIAKVALNQLGDAYGWGGMLSSDDCSGYVRDVYKCFGLELARNTTWQEAQPVCRYSFAGLDADQRAELIRSLPLGTVLFFNGHEMLYLGSEGDKLYVISSVSTVVIDGTRVRVRSGAINTLDIQRANGRTWLENLTTANIPYLDAGTEPLVEEVAYVCKSSVDAQWNKGSESGLTFVFERNSKGVSAGDHVAGIAIDGCEAVRDQDYRVLSDSAIVELMPSLLESLDAGEHSLVATFDDARATAVGFVTKTKDAPQVTTYAVGVDSSRGGFVGTSTAAAPEGANVTVTVRPDAGYVLSRVVARTSGGVELALSGTVEDGLTFVMPADGVTVRADFAAKASSTLSAKGKTKAVAYAKLRKGAQKVKGAVKVSGANGKVSYALSSATKKAAKTKKFKISSKGVITVPKNTKKGTYKLKLIVSCAGDAAHKAGRKTVSVTIKVR